MERIVQDSYKKTETLSMVDLLQNDMDNQLQAQHLHEACGQSLNSCTHSKGYINQPVFACLTCSNNSQVVNGDEADDESKIDYSTLSGFCLGCSMHCHLEHDIIELWHKRAFKCDCGNAKFSGCAQSDCQLASEPKADTNERNQYNHNFVGKYCYCERGYSPAQHTMHQCLCCQDWFHQSCIIARHLECNPHLKQMCTATAQESTSSNEEKGHDHLGLDEHSPFFKFFAALLLPPNGDFDAFICANCATQFDCLFVPYRWKSASVATAQSSANESTSTNVPIGMKRKFNNDNDPQSNASEIEPKTKRQKLEAGDEENKQCTRLLLDAQENKTLDTIVGGGLWFEPEWITKLCQCEKCLQNVYDRFELQWLFEDNATDDEQAETAPYKLTDIDSSQPLQSEFSTDAMLAQKMMQLPRKQTIDALSIVMKATDDIKEKLVKYLRANPDKKVVDVNDVANMFKNTK